MDANADLAAAPPLPDTPPLTLAPVVDGGPSPDVAPVRPQASADLDCASAGKQAGNAGCSFYIAQPAAYQAGYPKAGKCYAIFVANPSGHPAKLSLDRGGKAISLAHVARISRGWGPTITYGPFDETAGLAPGDIALIFLSGKVHPTPPGNPDGGVERAGDVDTGACPFGVETVSEEPTSVGRPTDQNNVKPPWASGMGQGFHLSSDRPIIAYDTYPYGGGASGDGSASLLLPQEAWTTQYLTATPFYQCESFVDLYNEAPFLIVVAGADGTDVAIKPTAKIVGGTGIVGGDAGQTLRVRLNAGQFAQFTEFASCPTTFTPGLSGTVVEATKPVSVIGGTPCFLLEDGACDSAHQQIPPLATWGHEYVAVRYRDRNPGWQEHVPWQFVGAVDGTVLTYEPQVPTPFDKYPAPAPTTLSAGQSVQFWTADPFVVRSQDSAHPFYVAAYMTGGSFPKKDAATGDPDFVNVVPTDQYMNAYTFLTDPTYPETSLVLIRKAGNDGRFADVWLDCAAQPITGWEPVGGYQFARLDLTTGQFQSLVPGCENGRKQIASSAPFSVTVWGWGTGDTTGWASYSYPVGAAAARVNAVAPPLIIQ